MAQAVQYQFSGPISAHRGRGRQLAVPTLNIQPPAEVPDGIYAGFVLKSTVQAVQRFPAAIFVGAAITFGETERQAEAHVLDAAVDMTGEITLELTHFIRGNYQFPDAAALQTQMAKDIVEIKQCLQELSKLN